MSLSSGLGTSFGGLNTGGNLSESSFLFVSPTDFTEFHRFLPYAGWDFASNLQISCYFLGGFEKKAYFCGRLQSKNLKGELLWIHWIKNFGKNVKLL